MFRRLLLEMLVAAHDAGRLQFFGEHARLADKAAFAAYLAPLRKIDWVVYAKEPFAGPEAGAALSVALHPPHRDLQSPADRPPTRTASPSSTRTIGSRGRARYKTMTLATDEFIRRFLIHVLPKGFHRIRHYGLLANGTRAANIAHARELLAVPHAQSNPRRPKQRSTSPACCRVHARAAAVA